MTELKRGQVWEVREESLLVLVFNADNARLPLCCPLLGPVDSGPEDFMVLDVSVFGFKASVSFELECSLPVGCLGRLQGQLTDKQMAMIQEASDFLCGRIEDITKDLAGRMLFNWGYNYIDELDFRWGIHEKLAERIEHLQEPIWEGL